jgi:hypothetical protein
MGEMIVVDEEMVINRMTDEDFEALPLIKMGESKEVRDAGRAMDGTKLCAIRFRPTIYSFTSNRCGVVPGSELLRLRATKRLVEVLREAGLRHAYRVVGERFVLAEYVRDPNVEVIVKRFHSGTSKHRYFGMSGKRVRPGSIFEDTYFEDMGAYPHAIVRFDWRNPFKHPVTGVRLADEVMPEDIADWWIDTKSAGLTALAAFDALSEFLGARDVLLYDLCLFISTDGRTIFGEISQDCGRFRHFDYGELDKDVWRAGGSHEEVLEKWKLLCEAIER